MHLLSLVAAVESAEVPIEKRIAVSLFVSGVVNDGKVLLPAKSKTTDVESFLEKYIVTKPYMKKSITLIIKFYKELLHMKAEDVLHLTIDEYELWNIQIN